MTSTDTLAALYRQALADEGDARRELNDAEDGEMVDGDASDVADAVYSAASGWVARFEDVLPEHVAAAIRAEYFASVGLTTQ